MARPWHGARLLDGVAQHDYSLLAEWPDVDQQVRTIVAVRSTTRERLTVNRVVTPALAGTVEAAEDHPGHPQARTIQVWSHGHLTDAATSSLPLLQAMCVDELAAQGEVRWP